MLINRIMLKKFLVKIFIIAILCVPTLAYAANLNDATSVLDSGAKEMGYQTGTDMNLEVMVGKVIQAFLGLLGVIFLVIVIVAGAMWMTAGGDTKRVQISKDWLTNGVVGLVIVLSAYAISSFIVSTLITNLGTVQ